MPYFQNAEKTIIANSTLVDIGRDQVINIINNIQAKHKYVLHSSFRFPVAYY